MRVFTQIPNIKGPSILIFGIFDGVHIAHQKIISNAIKQSFIENVPVVLCTFYKRPSEVIRGLAPNLLTSVAQKFYILDKLGVDATCITRFNKELAHMSALDWLDDVCRRFKPLHIFVGFNYHFGYKGQGDGNLLLDYEKKHNYKVHILDKMELHGTSISSTSTRNHILSGNIREANQLLGREFTIPLKVIKECNDRYILSKPNRMIKPLNGQYSVLLNLYNNRINDSIDTRLYIDNDFYILKKDLPNNTDLNGSIATRLYDIIS